MDDYYFLLDYSPKHLLDMMYAEASQSDNYYLSPANVLRCDVSTHLREELSKIINVPFNDCGFLKTKPLQKYPIHTDIFRIAAINMPLFDEITGFNSYVFTGKKIETVEYKKNYFTLLNVMKLHGVSNENPDNERIILSIGFKEHTYKELLEAFLSNALIKNQH